MLKIVCHITHNKIDVSPVKRYQRMLQRPTVTIWPYMIQIPLSVTHREIDIML
jgi:hypothetical protein